MAGQGRHSAIPGFVTQDQLGLALRSSAMAVKRYPPALFRVRLLVVLRRI